MADRQIWYFQQQVVGNSLLQMQQNNYIGLSRLMGELINYPALGGFLCTPTSPASLNVNIAAGEIYSQEQTDSTDYGMPPDYIPADDTLIVKQGIAYGTSFATPAPVTVGYSINYLIEIGFQETDGVPQSTVFYTGPAQTVNTVRQDLGIVQIVAGAAAPTGTQTTPTPDSGFIGAWVVTVEYGQTSVLTGNISQYPDAPFFGSSYGGAIQDMLTKTDAAQDFVPTPTNGGAASYIVYCSPAAGTSGPGTLVLTSSVDPMGWWNNATFTYTPTVPCTALFFTALNIESSVTQLISLGENTALFSSTLPISAGQTGSLSVAGARSFNGTTDSLSFEVNFSGGSADILSGMCAIVVIVN
jgi:hypothetical protein